MSPKRKADSGVLGPVEHLVAEEQALYSQGTLDELEVTRLEALKVELDECWTLLEQRRAVRSIPTDLAGTPKSSDRTEN